MTGMNCEQYRFELDTAGADGRLREDSGRGGPDFAGESARSAFRLHESECPACAALAAEHRLFDARVRRAMHDVAVPPRGPAAVARKLRSGLRSRLRRRAVQILSLAAALAIAVSLGYAWRDSRIVPFPDQPINIQNPQSGYERWVEDNSFEPADRIRFNGSLFSSAGPVEIRPGLAVPCLTLMYPELNATAQIYVFRIGDITEEQIDDLKPATPLIHSKILLDARSPDVRYLVVCTGAKLSAFLMPVQDD